MERVPFETWFKGLMVVARENGHQFLIDWSNPDSYREYYDDGDSPYEAFHQELSYHDRSFDVEAVR